MSRTAAALLLSPMVLNSGPAGMMALVVAFAWRAVRRSNLVPARLRAGE